MLAELNYQISHLEEVHDEQNQINDDDGALILGSACHPSNVPHSNSAIIPLSSPTITLTSNNTVCKTTHNTTLQINDSITVPALVTPELSSGLISVHEVTKRAGPIIFTPKLVYILNKNKISSTATCRNPFYKIDKNTRFHAVITNPIRTSPPKL